MACHCVQSVKGNQVVAPGHSLITSLAPGTLAARCSSKQCQWWDCCNLDARHSSRAATRREAEQQKSVCNASSSGSCQSRYAAHEARTLVPSGMVGPAGYLEHNDTRCTRLPGHKRLPRPLQAKFILASTTTKGDLPDVRQGRLGGYGGIKQSGKRMPREDYMKFSTAGAALEACLRSGSRQI